MSQIMDMYRTMGIRPSVYEFGTAIEKELKEEEKKIAKQSDVDEFHKGLVKDLTKDFSSNSIALIDLENYNFYKSSSFKEFMCSLSTFCLFAFGSYVYIFFPP